MPSLPGDLAGAVAPRLIGSVGGSFIQLLLVLAVIVLAVQLLHGGRSV